MTPVAPDVADQYCDDSDPTNPILVDGTITITAAAERRRTSSTASLPSPARTSVAPGAHTVTATFDTTKYKLAPGATVAVRR